MSVCKLVLVGSSVECAVLKWQLARRAYIDLSVLESLLQIVVDGFVRDLTDQSKIRNPNLLLLCGIKGSLLDVRLAAARCCSSSASILGFRALLALRSSADTLFQHLISKMKRRNGP